MGTAYPEVFAALARPFETYEVKTKPGGGGRKLSYITARTVANRLDEVLGPENWRQEFTETRDGMRCRLWYRLVDEWSWKEDGGGFAGMAAEDDNEKSAYSDSFKRAAAMLGVGRYLYQDGTPRFGDEPAPANGHAEPATSHRENPPPSHRENPAPRSAPANGSHDGPPRSGKALFAWAKKQDETTGLSVSEGIKAWGKSNGLHWQWGEWDEASVAEAYAYAMSKIAGPDVPGVQQGLPEDGPEPIESVKKRLKRAIRDMARTMLRHDNVTASDLNSAMAVLRDTADACHKPFLTAIDPLTEEHRDTMLWYLGQAIEETKTISQVYQGEGS